MRFFRSATLVAVLATRPGQGADLKDVDLSAIDLSDADLSSANLSWADLSSATGVTNEELEQHADALGGANMPNGQGYEDWLKSKG